MPFHNPFIKDGRITFPEGASLVKHVERWAKVRGDKLAYRFLDFSTERDGIARELRWNEFGARNRAIGARLQQVTEPGDRVAILCPQNLDYLVAFFGTLYSGRIAVPLFDPAEPGHVGRLHAVLDDCQPSAILTTTESAEGVRKFFRTRPAKERPRVIAVDAVPEEVGATWQHVDTVLEDTIAYLQYTSGSTRIPTGVQITHINLATNVVQVIEALEGEEADRGVSWLPFFHDMGLVTALLPSMIGHYFTFMTPAAFVRRPIRWMREIARQPGDTGGTISVAPNFAFDHAAARGLPKEGEEPLDLSNVKAILNGSEPISAATVKRFNDAFGPFGFPAKAIKPSYGLAEATLFVSTTPSSEEPTILSVDRDELNAGRFVPVPDDSPKAVAQAGAGKVGVGEWAAIVDLESAGEVPDGQIGEIWISGQNMGTGYWNKPEKSIETFHNILKSRTTPSHARARVPKPCKMVPLKPAARAYGPSQCTGLKSPVSAANVSPSPAEIANRASASASSATRGRSFFSVLPPSDFSGTSAVTRATIAGVSSPSGIVSRRWVSSARRPSSSTDSRQARRCSRRPCGIGRCTSMRHPALSTRRRSYGTSSTRDSSWNPHCGNRWTGRVSRYHAGSPPTCAT